jgi:hypothetical protein
MNFKGAIEDFKEHELINDLYRQNQQQADRIAELEKTIQDGIQSFGKVQDEMLNQKFTFPRWSKEKEMFDSWENHETSQTKQVWCKCGDGINPDSGAICGNCLASIKTTPQTKPLNKEGLMDTGVWDVRKGKDKWFIVASSHFKHDVEMTITGDFYDEEQNLAYCQQIADRLNDDFYPQTKPLSDEEIAVIWANHSVPMTGMEFLKVARAIEERHGIK